MDHPSKEWKDETDYPTKLKEDRRCFIYKDIKFIGLNENDKFDFYKCFRWEFNRTRIYLGQVFQHNKKEFPFYHEGFPSNSYLSYSLEERNEWKILENLSEIEDSDTLSKDFVGTNYVSEILGSKIPSTAVDITLEISPDLNMKDLKNFFLDNLVKIKKKIDDRKNDMIADGYIFPEPKNFRHIARLKSKLKVLGCYRLYSCVGLAWSSVAKEYELSEKASERRFRSDCKKLLPGLPFD